MDNVFAIAEWLQYEMWEAIDYQIFKKRGIRKEKLLDIH